jgi:serine/threonine protein kinase
MNKVPIRVDGRFRLKESLGSGSYGMSFILMLIQIQNIWTLLAVVYRAQNIINGDVVAVKLEPATDHSSSVEREYHILKQLEGGIGIPSAHWFGRESIHHALVLDLLGPSLQDIFLARNQKFSLHAVVDLGDQLVSQFLVVAADADLFS